jgi:copper chaperone CopZ
MKFSVGNMKCGGCTAAVKAKLEALEGVDSAEVDLASASAEVAGSIDPDTVVEVLTEAGYPTELID